MQIDSDIIYRNDTDYDPKLNSLDIYFTRLDDSTLRRPVVVFIHGGGWTDGDKAFPSTHDKDSLPIPRWFVDQGYVFVAINFRLAENYKLSKATIPDVLSDIAKALKWLTVNARRYGGKTKDFILLGHSSGGHLATLLAADRSYLKQYRMNPSIVQGVISMDAAHFDIPLFIDKLRYDHVGLNHPEKRLGKLTELIGPLLSAQNYLSPAHYIGPWLLDTRFLLLSAGFHYKQEQSLTLSMNESFKELLISHGVDVNHRHFANRDHSDFVNMFDREIQRELIAFLRRCNNHVDVKGNG